MDEWPVDDQIEGDPAERRDRRLAIRQAGCAATQALNSTSNLVSRRVNAERIVVLGWSRAILLQLAHPLIAAGVFPAGTPYSAEDPDLVLWVHATLLESIPMVYELIVRPLTADERDAYCAEAASVAADLGARREEIPQTWEANGAYLRRMYASGAIAVSAQTRALAQVATAPRVMRRVTPQALALWPEARRVSSPRPE